MVSTKAKKTSKSSSQDRSNERSFTYSKKALELIDKAKAQSGIKLGTFVSQCIEEYGPIILNSNDVPRLKSKLIFLDILLDEKYDALLKRLKKGGAIEAHQQLIEELPKGGVRDKIAELMKAATKKPKAKKTTYAEWALLIRKKKTFLDEE